MAPRVSPTEAIRAQIHQLFASGGELLSVIEQVAPRSVRLTFQSVVEEILCEELGRGRSQRRGGDSPQGYRNRWQQPRTLKTSLGPVELQRPSCATPTPRCATSCSGRRQPNQRAGDPVISCWLRACPTATWRRCWWRSSASRP